MTSAKKRIRFPMLAGSAAVLATTLLVLTAFAEEASHRKPMTNDPGDLVLYSDAVDLTFAWQLDYAGARQQVLKSLAMGRPEEALEAAKAQFALSPPEPGLLDAAAESVREALTALDGNDARARAYEQYAKWGTAGPDGKAGTDDDCKNPIADVGFSVLTKEGRYFEELDSELDRRAACSWFVREPVWFEVQKAYARLNGCEFEDALKILLQAQLRLDRLLRSIDKRDAVQLGNTEDYQKMILHGIGVVYRALSSTTVGMADHVRMWQDYLRYGPAGKDMVLGTQDDIIPALETGGWSAPAAKIPPRLAEALACDDGGEVGRCVRPRLKTMQEIYYMVATKLQLIVESDRNNWGRVLAGVAPSPYETYALIRAQFERSRPSLNGLSKDEAAQAQSRLAEALLASVECAADKYKEMLSKSGNTESTRLARAFLTAYVLGTHEDSNGPTGAPPAIRSLADGGAPLFLVDDALREIGDYGAALAAVSMLDATDGAKWPQGERARLLTSIADKAESAADYDAAASACRQIMEGPDPAAGERLQHRIIDTYMSKAARAQKEAGLAMGRGETGATQRRVCEEACAQVRDACAEYIRLFPTGPDVVLTEYRKVVYEYRAGDFQNAIDDAGAFIEKHPASNAVAEVMYVQGLGYRGLKQNKTAIDIFEKVFATHLHDPVAGDAEMAAGFTYLSGVGDRKKGEECFQKVIDMLPRTPSAEKAATTLKHLLDQDKGKSL